MLSKDSVSNWRGEGAVVVEPRQESVERRTRLLRRVGDRGLGRALRDHKGNRAVWILQKESMPMEAALAVFSQSDE